MKFTSLFLATTLLSDVAVSTLVVPPAAEVATHRPLQNTERDESSHEDLWKRKGGGGGGGRGGGGSSGGSSSGSSGGRGGSSGSSGSSGAGRVTPSFGGGKYYGGGAATPYKSGRTSPSGIAPIFFAAGFLAFWPGVWLYGAHYYPYHNPYRFYNESSQNNETKAVSCACDATQDCGCDENGDTQYMTDLIGNGSYDSLNKTLVNVADVNGTSTILINGTLPAGTADTEGSSAGEGLRALLHHAGWWPVAATVCAIVFTV